MTAMEAEAAGEAACGGVEFARANRRALEERGAAAREGTAGGAEGVGGRAEGVRAGARG